jgi:hypothetical protein
VRVSKIFIGCTWVRRPQGKPRRTTADIDFVGFYVHACQKMKYKAGYAPSQLLDPVRHSWYFVVVVNSRRRLNQENFQWYPFTECARLLDENHYACFSSPERSLKEKGTDEGLFVVQYLIALHIHWSISEVEQTPGVDVEDVRVVQEFTRAGIVVTAPEVGVQIFY